MTLSQRKPWIGGYPAPFNATPHLLYDKPTDMIWDHYRHNKPEIMKILSEPKTHKFVGSIREPYSHMLSSFNYYYHRHTPSGSESGIDAIKKTMEREERFSKYWTSCRFQPWYSVVEENSNATFENYLNKLIIKTKTNGYKLPLSQMPHHQKAINFQIEEYNNLPIDQIFQEFDFIIVLERMAESLIILREILCAGPNAFQSVIDMATNQRTYHKPNFNDQQKRFIEKYVIDRDLQFYERANLELDRHVENYGKEKLWNEIEAIREQNSKSERKKRKALTRKRRSLESLENEIHTKFLNAFDEAVYQYRNHIKCGYGYNYDINDEDIKTQTKLSDGSNKGFFFRI